MTTLLEQIKADQLAARKDRDALRALLLTTLIGEATAIGKNAGNREVTDAEVVALMKKFDKGIVESIAALGGNISNDDGSADRYVNLLKEQSILQHYMPQQMDEQVLTLAVRMIINEIGVGATMGQVMTELKTRLAGQYDGKMASAVVKACL